MDFMCLPSRAAEVIATASSWRRGLALILQLAAIVDIVGKVVPPIRCRSLSSNTMVTVMKDTEGMDISTRRTEDSAGRE